MKVKKTVVREPKVREAKVSVSEANIGKASLRLLKNRLVSTEVAYVQRALGNTATQDAIDTQILAVRKLPWSVIAGE